MSVYNYDKLCKYSLGDLAHEVYFYAFNKPKIEYTMDSDDYQMNGICSSIEGNSIKMYCDRVAFTTETSSDNRYAFKNKLNIQLLERTDSANTNIIKFLLSNKLMVVFCDREGNKWILNPEFPITINYSYNITDTNNNITSIDLISNSNIPPLVYLGNTNFSDIIRDKAKRYNVGKIKKLELASIYDIFFKNTVSGFQIIEKGIGKRKNIHFDKGSLNFKEEYDGSDFKQTLTFNIPFKKYKSYFHIDLLEYVDNKYYALIKTTNDNLIIGGYRQGMFPEFTINTTEDNNSIAITLSAIYQNYNLLTTDSSESIVIDDITYDKIFGECINNVYTYTLLQKKINNKLTNDYYCLEGFQSKYPTYNIVGTYNSNSTEFGKIKDYNVNCVDKCDIQGLPTSIVFNKINEIKTFSIITDCEITFNYDKNKCEVSYNNGTLLITNKIEKGDYNITVNLSDGTTRNISVIVDKNASGERTINITAKAQNIDIIANKGVGNVTKIETTLNYSENQYGNGYIVSVTENESPDKRTFDFIIHYNDNTKDIVHIIQDILYKELVSDGTTRCIDGNKWEMWVERVGYTPDKININRGYIKGQIIEHDSAECIEYDDKTNIGTICVNKITHNIIQYKKNGVVITTKLESIGTACDDSTTKYKYIVNKDRAICINGVAYNYEDLYASRDGKIFYLVTPIQSRPSNEVDLDSNVCSVIYPDKGKILYRWYNNGDTACLDESQNINCEDNRNITPIPGDKSTYICDGVNKWSMIEKYISPLCDNKYQFIGYEKDKLIEENSDDCQGGSVIDDCRWREIEPTEGYFCDGVDKWTKEIQECKKYPTSPWIPNGQERKGTTVIEKNSVDCMLLIPDLAFEYSGDTAMTYNINGTKYTTDKSPFSINTKNDLGIENITSMKSMFYQGYNGNIQDYNPNNITNISKIPDASNVTNMESMFERCSLLTSLNVSNLNTSNVLSMRYMFESCSSLSSLDLSSFNTSKVTDMYGMFDVCENLTSLNLSNFDTSNLTRMGDMFNSCKKLTSLDLSNFNTSKVTEMSGTFWNCGSLTSLNLSSFDTSNVTDMSWMFGGCGKLPSINVSNFNTANVDNMEYMFNSCKKLTSLDLNNFNTSKVTDMRGMFGSCELLTSLDLSSFNTSNVTNMWRMFGWCSNLTSLNLSNFNTSKVTDMEYMFDGCNSLSSLDLSNWDIKTECITNDMFVFCTALTSITMNDCSCETIKRIQDQLVANEIKNVTIYSNTGCAGTVDPSKPTKECRWVKAPQGQYLCEGTTKYEKEIEECRETPTSEWLPSGNERKGAEIEKNSTDCGYVPPTPVDDDLAFEFSGSTPMKYIINGTQYTANQSPFSINTKNDLGIENITRMKYMFYQGYDSVSGGYFPNNITKISKIPYATNVTDMREMFKACKSLTEIIGLKNLNTTNVTNMNSMFRVCESLTALDLSSFSTSKVTDMGDMFQSCSSLITLDLSNFDTSNVINMKEIFWKCNSLVTLDLSNWDIKAECITDFMFSRCESLTSITMDNCSCETINRVIDKLTDTSIRDNVTIYSNTGCAGTIDPSKPTDGDLAFEYSGDTAMAYKINGTKYTADKSPFIINTKTDLGINTITDMSYMFGGGTNITAITKIPDSTNVTYMSGMFRDCTSLTSLDLSSFNVRKVYYFDNMFTNCTSLTTLNLSNWNFKENYYANDMFLNCTALTSITMDNCSCETINEVFFELRKANIGDNVTIYSNTGCASTIVPSKPGDGDLAFEFSGDAPQKFKINGTEYTVNQSPFSIDTKKYLGINIITSMKEMFQQPINRLKNITNISKIPDTSNVTDMSWMFYMSHSLTNVDLSNFDTSKVIMMNSMFDECYSLTSLDLSSFNTSNVTDMNGMFDDCSSLTSLDLSKFNTANVTNMSWMFIDCHSLTSLDLSSFNTSNVTYMSSMFSECRKLTSLNLSNFDTAKVTDMEQMFFDCNSLTSLDLSNFNTSNVTNMRNMFSWCSNLTTIIMKNCSQSTVNKIKTALTNSGIPDGQVTIITQ